MHVHQQQSQTCKMGKPPALREVKHPRKDRTSVNRPPSTEQEVLSQFSSYSGEIEHFTRDPCKPHLKSCLQSTKHAFKKQEVNTHTDCEHSYRMEHAEHFPAPMEMCMDDHLLSEPSELQPLKAMAHWYTEKEAHLLSEPSELQPLKAMAHQYRHTEKEAHLLSGPSGLQPSEDSETQKFRSSTQVQQPRQEYSRFTETEKAKFQTPFTYNDERNFVRRNSVDKFSPTLVYMTTPNTSSVSNSVFFRKKGRKCRYCRNCGRNTCSRRTCTYTHTGDSWKMTTYSKNKEVNKELWEASQHT